MFASKNQNRICLISFLLFALVSAGYAEAAQKDKQSKRNNQISQLRQQKAQLEADNQAKVAELAEKEKALQEASRNASIAGGSLKKVKALLANSSSELEKTKEILAQKETELGQTKSDLELLNQQHKQALADLDFNNQQRKTQVENIKETTKRFNDCSTKNELLYSHGKFLTEIYQNQSFYENVMRNEKFFQLKRVELENILQGKLDQLDSANMTLNPTP
jgi:chromosome segregation ATPase